MDIETSVPNRYRGIMRRALEGTASPRQAIKARCIECCGFDRAVAAECGVRRCPLYAYNPYRKTKAARRSGREKRSADQTAPEGTQGQGQAGPAPKPPVQGA